jgi:hypothetical protein
MPDLASDGSDVPSGVVAFDSRAPRPPRASDARRAEVLAALPDAPWLVYARSLLQLDRCDVVEAEPHGHGVCLVEDEADLVVVLGQPGARSIRYALAGLGEDAELLAHPSAREHVLGGLPRWGAEHATLHTAAGLVVEPELARRALASGATLSVHGSGPVVDTDAELLPRVSADPELGRWLDRVARRAPVAAAWLDGRPVAFAYAAYMTDTRFDLGVDTLEPARRKGLAAAAAALLAERLVARGLQPVWGAAASNEASQRDSGSRLSTSSST